MTEREVFEWIDLPYLYKKFITNGEKFPPKIVEIEGKKIQKLPEIVRGAAGLFVMKKRVGNCAIFQKIATRGGLTNYDYFEVIIIKKSKAKENALRLNNVYNMGYNLEEIPDIKEHYPTDEDFGRIAWAFRDLKSSEERFEELLKLEEEKANAK